MVTGPWNTSVVQLAPRYYRDNFQLLCHTVERQYADLLHTEEQNWLAAFSALPAAAQCLYIRLISRVGPWFRCGKLNYPEIGELTEPLAILLAQGFLIEAEALEVVELGRLYTRPELQRHFAAALARRGPTKADDLDAIAQWAGQQDFSNADLLSVIRQRDGDRIVAATALETVELLQLLFFGNRRQSLTEFVLSDLGVATYYPYRLDRAHRLFPDRASVDDYLACGQLADQFAELSEAADDEGMVVLAQALLNVAVVHPASERRWWRLFNRVARQLERLGQWEQALALYQSSALPPARERAARVYEAQHNWPAAIQGCQRMVESPDSEEEREAALRMLPRLQRKAGIAVTSRPRDQFSRVDLTLRRRDLRVELQAAEELLQDWPAVHYVENTLINGLFGLAFWEEIFSPAAGAFHNPFQSVPTDMYEGGFYRRRKSALDRRLSLLEHTDLLEFLSAQYQRFEGLQCRWVNWRMLPRPLLEHALQCIPCGHLLAIWRRMLFDPAENRRGFPDLIALGEEKGNYQMIEIKGPGDALQESQKRWLRFFAGHNIPASVAWVQWVHD